MLSNPSALNLKHQPSLSTVEPPFFYRPSPSWSDNDGSMVTDGKQWALFVAPVQKLLHRVRAAGCGSRPADESIIWKLR
jgi:hypothetical protein